MAWRAHIIAVAAAALCASGCALVGLDSDDSSSYDRVLILYSAGSNSISSALTSDIKDLSASWLPQKKSNVAVVVAAHNTSSPASVIRMYRNKRGDPVRDTMTAFDAGASLADASVMREALSYIEDNFPSEHYRMVFSSHASDWLPETKWNFEPPTKASSRDVRPNSIGYETVAGKTYEMTLDEFAGAFPMRMDAILFDACLMAGVEVAYALRDVCDYMAFSPAEVMSDGFDYEILAEDLLQKDARQAVEDVAAHFFAQYARKADSDISKSATVSAVRSSGMEALAALCRTLFERYRAGLERPSRVPQYFDGAYTTYYNEALDSVIALHWCYDLQDIMSAAGISEADSAALQDALDEAVFYKATTARRYSAGSPQLLDVNAYCGLTMYLPSLGSQTMTDYWRTLSWNQATGLAE